ncbi:MAG: hypothetical protein ACOZAR_00435 [Patescibacteria group bacterium]
MFKRIEDQNNEEIIPGEIDNSFTKSANILDGKGESVIDASTRNYGVMDSISQYFNPRETVQLSDEMKEKLKDVDVKQVYKRLDKIKIFTNQDLVYVFSEASKMPVSKVLDLMEMEYKKDTIHPESACFKYLFDNIKQGGNLPRYDLIGDAVNKLKKSGLEYRNEKKIEKDRYEEALKDTKYSAQSKQSTDVILSDESFDEVYKENLKPEEYSKELQNYLFAGVYNFMLKRGCNSDMYYKDFVANTIQSSKEKGIDLAGN